MRNLNKSELLKILKTKSVSKDICFYDEKPFLLYQKALKFNIDISIDESKDKYNYKNGKIAYYSNLLLEQLAESYKDKIAVFSDFFWEIFDYRENEVSNTIGNWNEIPKYAYESKERKRKTKILLDFKKYDLLNNLTNYLTNGKKTHDEYIDLWFDLIVKDDISIKEIPEFLINYNTDLNQNIEKNIMKMKMLDYIANEESIKIMKDIYLKSLGTTIQEDIFSIYKKYDNIETIEIPLFNERKDIVYRNVIDVDKNALSQKYKIKDDLAIQIMEFISKYINCSLTEFNSIKASSNHKWHPKVNNSFDYDNKLIYTFELSSYNENSLNILTDKFLNTLKSLPNLLIKPEYQDLIKTCNLSNTLNNDDVLIFCEEYIKKSKLYSDLDDKINIKKEVEVKRKKI